MGQALTITEDTLDIRVEHAIQTLTSLIEKGHSLILTLSGGKDSSVTTVLALEAIKRCVESGVQVSPCYISSATTKVENPAMEHHLFRMHDEIREFVDKYDLPVVIRIAEPAVVKQFVVSTLGRGTLPRFIENSAKKRGVVKVGGGRQCAKDWKVDPQEELAKELHKLCIQLSGQEPVTLIGTRTSESTVRKAAMEERGESATHPWRNKQGFLNLSPIMDWSVDDVWECLITFTLNSAPFETINPVCFSRAHDLYADANEGACGISIGDGGQQAACGSRFGCSFCVLSGETDKSMESMVKDDKYAFMRGINAFRNLLIHTQYDLSKRELVGRTVSPAGYAPVRPDVYSIAFRRQMLSYLLTLDALEIERAEEQDAAICRGDIENTPDNRAMAEPQFQLVSEEQIFAIDFMWGLHRANTHAFSAIEMWYQVHTLGRRFLIPDLEKSEKVKIPEKRWFHVGAYDAEAPTDGLRDYMAEQWNPYLHPNRPTFSATKGERVVYHEEEDGFTVDMTRAIEFLEFDYVGMMIESRNFSGLDGVRFFLNEGIIKVARGKIGIYHRMAKRAQYFDRLMQRLNITHAELDQHLIAHSISDAEHSHLSTEYPDSSTRSGTNLDLFEF